MRRLPIRNLAAPGFVPDLPSFDLPTPAWSDSRNVRYADGAVEKLKGYAEVWGNLSATAIWAMPISTDTTQFWMYGSETALYATDGTTHADIAGSVSISATQNLGYTGGALHGFAVISDGKSIPQVWSPGLANNLVSLTAWPALTLTCEVIRPWRSFLVALRIEDTGSLNPRLMRWSDAASPGGLPLSWDYTDPTNQAGIKEFGESEDMLVDCEQLRDSLVIYKTSSTWIGEYVGGADVVGFRQLFTELGALSQDCIGSMGASHVVLAGDDLVLHDGNSARSLLDRRARRWLFNRIDPTNYRRCWVAVDNGAREVWVAYPEQGASAATQALVWNWAEDTLYPVDLGVPMTYGTYGIITGTASTFDTDTTLFDADAAVFNEEAFSPFRRALIMTRASAARAVQQGVGETQAGASMTCYAQRDGTVVSEDLGSIKRVWRIWPMVTGTAGAQLDLWIGARTALSASPAFEGPYRFTIGTDNWVDVRFDARIIDLRVEYTGTNTWRLHGLDVEYDDAGER